MRNEIETAIDEIAGVLKSWGVSLGGDERRREIAATIAATGQRFDDEVLRELVSEARDGQGARKPIGLVVSWLLAGTWVEILADIRAARAKLAEATRTRQLNEMTVRRDPVWDANRARFEVLALAFCERRSDEDIARRTGRAVSEVRSIVREHGPGYAGEDATREWLDPMEAARRQNDRLERWRRFRAGGRPASIEDEKRETADVPADLDAWL